MRSYQKHTITCRCILSQHKNIDNPPNFSFIVLSYIDNDNIIEKLSKCPNCGIIHRVYELCKSEILNDETENIISIDDIKHTIPEKVSLILDDYSCELHVYEEAKFIIDSNNWGRKIILTREYVGTHYEGKLLEFNDRNNYEINYWKSAY